MGSGPALESKAAPKLGPFTGGDKLPSLGDFEVVFFIVSVLVFCCCCCFVGFFCLFGFCYRLLSTGNGWGTAPVKTLGVLMEVKQSLANLALQCQAMKSQWQCLKYTRLGSFICSCAPSIADTDGVRPALSVLRNSRKNTGTDKATAPKTADAAVFEGCLVYYLLAFASKK